ncbi:MAG: outer membrane lipoprotein-sorting protein [Gammaproteobacteria bacterium]|nr:outer membrane lipoprotein-sorting protein [Gammaproteobacteria bacterium]
MIASITALAQSADVVSATADKIMERSQRAYYFAGEDAKGMLRMELIDRKGNTRQRVLTMLRRNRENSWEQKYFMYFHEPGDVRRLTFMIWKYPQRDDDRWIYVPAVDLIRRIAAEDKYSSFVGSDFSYEDVSGRDLSEDTHSLLDDETLDDRKVFVIESIPLTPAAFTRRVSWIDKEHFLPLKIEYYDAQDRLQRIFTANAIEDIATSEGDDSRVHPTAMKRTMENVRTGHRTEVTVTSVNYDVGLSDDDFSERYMRRPPRAWIR